MSRWLLTGFLYLGIGFGSDLSATVLVDPFTDEPSGFLTMAEDGPENVMLRSLWERIQQDGSLAIIDAWNDQSGREVAQPTTDQSIAWAASQTEGPIQALAMSQMPHLDGVVPLLVDFRNRVATSSVAPLADVSPAFIGETPEPRTAWPVLAAVVILVAVRRKH